jgi:hypothetical protein
MPVPVQLEQEVQADGFARLHCAQIEVGRAAEKIARRKRWAAQLFLNVIILDEAKKLYLLLDVS